MCQGKAFVSRKCFGVLSIVTAIMLWIQLSKLEDRKSIIEKYHNDIPIDELKEEENVFPVVDYVDYNDTGPVRVEEIIYPLFQSNESAEFPHLVNGSIRIPHIIHQICNTPSIPDIFVDAMRSFVYHNPTWQYRFWTYESGRKFLQSFHPYLLKLFDGFGENDVKKSDVIRLAAIYEYGGLYADLDVRNLRSLNKTTTKYACILSPEPFEHSTTIYNELAIMSNSVLLCRPKHPFYKQLLVNLQLANPTGHPMTTTGPMYITDHYLKYNNLTKEELNKLSRDTRTNSPYFYKGNSRDEESEDGIYIPNSQYFLDSIDPFRLNEANELRVCLEGPLNKAPLLKQRACKEYQSRKKVRREKKFTFTYHYWYHLWVKSQDLMRRWDIKTIIPTAILYAE